MWLPSCSWMDLKVALIVGVITVVVIALSKYRLSIRKRVEQLDVLRVVRVDTKDRNVSAESKKMQQVQLNPEFVQQCRAANDPPMISLGDYLSSLRPAGDEQLPDWLDTAVQNTITRALLKGLGSRLGRAVLPALGTSFVQNSVSNLVSTLLAHFTSSHEQTGAVMLPLSAIPGMAQLNYNVQKSRGTISEDSEDWKTSSDSPIYLLKGGEVGFSPSFSEVVTPPASDDDLLVPNPFIISKDWDRAITKMEELLVSAGEDTKWKSTNMDDEGEQEAQKQDAAFVYDAQSKAMKEPVVLGERLLPDLHVGWGSASCTHTHQEILKNRLLSVLLNRLASNYFYSDEAPFQVKVDESSKAMTRPTELMQALIDMGHSIESCVRSNITTFGVALCVQERDESYTNVPLAIFMHNGYNDKDGNEVYACLPHSGLNLEIRGGPLLQHGSLQHYIAIEGLCCWNSNHNADVPWMRDVDCGDVMRGSKMIDSIRTAAMEAIFFNTTAARLQLPHGGYGLTGVCNDSAAMIQYALSGRIDVYPLTLNGRFTMQLLRCAMALRDKLRGDSSMRKEVDATNRLIESLLTLGSDTNSLPSEASDQIRRQLHVQQPMLPFSLMRDNIRILGSIQKELESAS